MQNLVLHLKRENPPKHSLVTVTLSTNICSKNLPEFSSVRLEIFQEWYVQYIKGKVEDKEEWP
jgi:hypothetical protein